MDSLKKTYDKKKHYGQVYTPSFIVTKILDEVGFTSTDVLGKKILDPACGDGRFLIEVVRRIIGMSPHDELEKNLSCFYGWDIDENAVEECKRNLDRIVQPLGIRVKWNISVKNALHQLPHLGLFSAEPPEFFDFIVGNPPYIRIQLLKETERKFIQQYYEFCKTGSTDIYIAFFELAYHLLSPDGVAGFITPNTFLYTETARNLREFFARGGYIKKIFNYGDIQLFDEATTYSAITIFTKKTQQSFDYYQAVSKDEFLHRVIETKALIGKKSWGLSVDTPEKIKGLRLGDICSIHVGITTLCDKAYIFPIEPLDDKTVWAYTKLRGKVKLEKSILKPIVKASKLKSCDEPIREYILFPYQRVNGKMGIIPEEVLAKEFPLAYQYLLSVKPELDRRDKGRPNPVAWYAFGRSQSLQSCFGKKIIFSPINRKPNFVLCENEEYLVYSGYFIKYDGDTQWLLEHLNSPEMEYFIACSSRNFRNGWRAYNKKVIENFIIPYPTHERA
jgi:methylase of polypeptide subunit release factors